MIPLQVLKWLPVNSVFRCMYVCMYELRTAKSSEKWGKVFLEHEIGCEIQDNVVRLGKSASLKHSGRHARVSFMLQK